MERVGRAARHAGRHRSLTIRIRPALYGDLAQLPLIERSAARAFRGSSEDAVADDSVSPVEFYIPFQTDGLVLVSDGPDGLTGFSACQACEDALHLWELAVRHDAQQQGLGRALVEATLALARARRLPAVTLSTFREIPWNAPFYRRLGFQDVPPEAMNARLSAIRLREELLGLPVARRVFLSAAA